MPGAMDGGADGDTILAMSSPPGMSSSAVLRLSGPAAFAALGALAVPGATVPGSGFQGARVSLDVEGARVAAWALFYHAPRSYTREDVVELTVPGSAPLLVLLARAFLEAGNRLPGGEGAVRWARPGEFTLRAFLSGRIDLSQAESVAGLISATGEAEALASRRGLRGDLRVEIEALLRAVLEGRALVEAALDFPDEDLPQVSPGVLATALGGTIEGLEGLRRAAALRIASPGALRVVLAGFPNAGKSSLLNALLGRRAAITSDLPGTTRDPVRGAAVYSGRRVEWVDIAGVEDLEGGVHGGERPGEEAIWGVVRRLTRLELEAADVVLWVADPLDRLERSMERFRSLEAPAKRLVLQKIDRSSEEERARLASLPVGPLLVSARTREGLGALVERVLGEAVPGEVPSLRGAAPPRFLVSAHQEAQLERAAEALSRARDAILGGMGLELAASDLRDASHALEELVGGGAREAVLDLVFSRFCIGK
ncbi:MAG TPA: GTPase [Planctomycetota bacterium]|nr:GTPase [Planctomycetota bacterium]